jgi:hypothetical protein
VGRIPAAAVAAAIASLVIVAPAGAQDPPSGEQKPRVAAKEPKGEQKRPDVVRVGALINDIQQLELSTHSYNVDMYMWFRWKDPERDPSNTFEFMNAFELWGHILTHETGTPQRLPNGDYLKVVRNQGKFNAKLPLGKYPFDTQNLLVEMEDTSADTSKVIYKPDRQGVTLAPGVTLPGWDIGDPTLRVVDNTYPTDFGDYSAPEQTYSRVIIDVPVERPAGTYALKLLLPMLLVALTAALSLAVHPRWVEGRVGIGITALLTLVALQLTSNASLPEVNYLLLLDKLYILSYVFVVLTLAVIARNSWVDATGDMVAAVRADRRGLALLTGGYFLCAAVLIILDLT